MLKASWTISHVSAEINDASAMVTPVKKTELTAGGIRFADHTTPSLRNSWH
jgi:hypothetical protein